MSVSLSPIFNGYQSFLANGLPNNGGFIYTYAAGTTTPAATYTTNSGATPNANPIQLSADGRPPQEIWLTDGTAYKFVVTDANLVPIPSASFDNITGITSASFPASLAASSGASLVGMKRSAIAGSVNSALNLFYDAQWVNVKADFGAKGDGTTDDTACMQAAHATGRLVYYPAGTYKFSVITGVVSGGIVGDGPSETMLRTTTVGAETCFTCTGAFVNYNPGNASNVLVFRDFLLSAGITKTGGAGIQIAPSSGEAQQTTFSNVAFYYLPTCIDFVAASFWKVTGCNFLGYSVAGIKVANTSNADSGDGYIGGNIFSNPNATGHGVWQQSAGGLKIVGNKFLGGATSYFLDYNGATSTSDLLISANSFESAHDASIKLTRNSGTQTFSQIVITGNQFALATAHISTDSSGLLNSLNITGNSFWLWTGYSSSTFAIGLNAVANFNISGNVFKGNGGTAVGISSTNCTNGKIGPNTYKDLTTVIAQSGADPLTISLDAQSGTVTSGTTGYSTYGSSFISGVINVTFAKPFLVAPTVNDIELVSGSGTGAIAGIVGTPSVSGFSCFAITNLTGVAAVLNWKAWGIL